MFYSIRITLISIIVIAFSFATNLVVNGDFESWDDATSPTGWTKVENIDQESTVVNGGSYAAKHTGGTKDLGQYIDVVGGHSYTLTLSYNVTTENGTDGRLWSYWKDADGGSLSSGDIQGWMPDSNNQWSVFTVTATAPADAAQMYLEVRTYSGGVVVWDDFSLVDNDASTGDDGGATTCDDATACNDGATGDCEYVNVGWGNLQHPYSTTVDAESDSETIYGRVWVDGVTGSGNGTDNGVIAELGYGSDGSTADDTWTWVSAYADGTVDGNNDQVSANLNIADAGTYSYSYRYRYDSSCWFYASETGSVTVNALTEYAVTFDLDMTYETIADGDVVNLFSADINGDWYTGTALSDDDGDGVYSVTLNLTAGSYLYKFKNGGDWESVDGTTCAVLDDPDGDGWGYYDREVVVSDSDVDLDTVCFSACEACVGGCTDENATNFDSTANANDGTCDYVVVEPGVVFFSEYAEGSSNNKYLEFYNGGTEDVDLGDYEYVQCSGGCDDWEYSKAFCATYDDANGDGDWDSAETCSATPILNPGDVFTVCHKDADDDITASCDLLVTLYHNGDDTQGLVFLPTNTVLDVVGAIGADPGSGWEVAGTANGTKDYTLVRKSTVTAGNPLWFPNTETGEAGSAGTNADDSEWIVTDKPTADYSPNTLGTHPHSSGCTDSTATNYDDSADISDGSCEYACDDVDEDNVCDDVDDCVGAFDECGVCNGTGPVEDYDCDGNLLVSVTFNVDMSEQTVDTEGYGLSLFMPSPYGYHSMTDEDGDGVWSVTLTLVSETTYSYKYKNGDAWEANFNDLGCGDGGSYGNRTFTSADADQSLDTVCFSSCSACVTCAYDGDTNADGIVNVSDVVMIVGWIIGNGDADLCVGDVNTDGVVNVSDVVMIVGWIIGERSVINDATNADVILSDNTISINANGHISGAQITLSHGPNFSIDLTDNAYIAEYMTSENVTKLVVVSNQSSLDHIATCKGSFNIESVIIVNSNQQIADVNILNLEPVELTLAGPNPFNPTTSLNVIVANDGYVSVNVYNIVGQHVATLLSGYMDANTSGYTVNWNASNLSSGVYLVRAETAGSISTQKLMLLK